MKPLDNLRRLMLSPFLRELACDYTLALVLGAAFGTVIGVLIYLITS